VASEGVDFKTRRLEIKGHAMELRCAEDPMNDFTPVLVI
jgi:acetyl/propionyl-CoA carboxylase alpha subunit